MMAIAQKCGLHLSALPSTLEPSLMDEPCDWDVCTEASTPVPASQLLPRSGKKKQAKARVPVSDPNKERAAERDGERKPDKTCPAPKKGPHAQENVRHTSARGEPVPLQDPTRKELQDALPKIPPLSSFKKRAPAFMSLKEAELDFQAFMTTGLGRSVEIIREFRDKVDGEHHQESVTLHEDEDEEENVKPTGDCLKSKYSPQRSASSSCGSASDMEDDVTPGGSDQSAGVENKPISNPPFETTTTAHKPFVSNIYDQNSPSTCGRTVFHSESTAPAPSTEASRQTNRRVPAKTHRAESKNIKKSKKLSERKKRDPKRERDDEDCMDQDDEWSSEAYWRACYRAWSDYYTAMSHSQGQGHQGYYDVAHNWMAAYRMNTVYMQELLKH